MRVATIDIGTNTVLLLVADRQSDGSLIAVAERARITRLGEGVDRSRRLAAAAVDRTTACLREFAQAIRELSPDRVAVVGTSAMRDATGGAEFATEVQALFGVAPRVITGEAEARLTFRGATGGLPTSVNPDVAVFDIGGGSTEVVLGRVEPGGRPHVEYSSSFDIGSVRLTERHAQHDPPNVDELELLVRESRKTFALVPAVRTGQTVIGIAGTMTTLAAVSLGLRSYDGAKVHGLAMRREELERVVRDLASVPLQSRRLIPGMEPNRADVILAGGSVALALLQHWGVDDFIVSDRGVRWGLAEELAAPREIRESGG
jgi:exopolyphosphatase/guanosine-5'-triphosphate,3'-diphosphate pyrophosphatase